MGIATFNATNTRDRIDVVWYVAFAGIRKRYGSCKPSWNPTDTSTNRTIYDYLAELIQCRAQSVEPLNGKTTSHGLTFSLVDANDEITTLMSVHDETITSWAAVASDCTAGAATLKVSATSGFTTPCDLFIGQETMRAASKTTLTFAVARGMYSSATADHLVTDEAGNVNTIEVWGTPRYFVGRGVTLWESRSDLAEADAAGLYSIINSVDEDDGVWTFSAAGVLSLVAGKLNRSPAWAMTQVPAPLMLITGGTGAFAAASAGVKEPWIIINNKAIAAYSVMSQYVGKPADWRLVTVVAAPSLLSNQAGNLSVLSSEDPIPTEGVEVIQCCSHVLFRDGATKYTDPLSVLLCLLLSKDGDKTNHATYDILPKGMGLGLEPRFVAVEKIEALRNSGGYRDIDLRFVIKEGADAKKWIEENLLRPNLLFMVETWDGAVGTTTGAITVKRLLTRNEAVIAGSDLDITEDMLLDIPKFEMTTLPIGEIKWQINFDPIEDKYMGEITVIFAESIARYRGAANKYAFELQTVYDDRIGKSGRVWRSSEHSSLPAMLGNYISTIWDRFALNPLPILTVELPYNRLTDCYPGNIVRVTCSVTPDVKNSRRGLVAEYFQIVEMGPDPQNGCIKLKLCQIGVHDVNSGRLAPSARIESIKEGVGVKAKVYIYHSVYAGSTGYYDYKFFSAGDKVRFYTSEMVQVDSTNYTVHKTSAEITTDVIELEELIVTTKPSPEDGAILSTAPYDSCTSVQVVNWVYMAGTNYKLGSGNDEGDQRT